MDLWVDTMELYENISGVDSFWDGLFKSYDIIKDIGNLIADLADAID